MRGRAIRLVMAAAALATVLAAAGDASAQRRPRRPPRRPGRPPARAPFAYQRYRMPPQLGLRGGYDFDTRSGMIGADFRLPLPAPRGPQLLALRPSGDLIFSSPTKDWQLNLDGELHAPRSGLYGGGGAAFIHHPFDPAVGPETKAGWNLFAGLEPGFLPIRPFVETRWTFRGEHYSAFRLIGGVHINIGRPQRVRR